MRFRTAPKVLAASLAGLVSGGVLTGSEFVWPTPNTAFAEGKAYTEFIQPTESGLIESGMFGCVRNSGWKFHEALDLFPLKRDRRGEAADPVFAMAGGVVRHAAKRSGFSSYGRYSVVEHTEMRPAIITLYAHLLSIAPAAGEGNVVEAGQTIGMMGRSAANYTIPRNRAHVHVEAGVWLSRNFQRWYNSKKYSTKNTHGVYNGMNIIGFDLLDYLERERTGQVRNLTDYLERLPTAVTIVIRTSARPDFVDRYSELVGGTVPSDGLGGWRIDFTWYGLPKMWRPVSKADVANMRSGSRSVVFHDAPLTERFQCQDIVRTSRGGAIPGPKANEVLDILFAGL